MEHLLKSIDAEVDRKNQSIGFLRGLRTALFAATPRTKEVLERVYEVFGEEGTGRWMVAYSRHLGATPAEFLLDGRADEVLNYVNQIDYGVYL